MAQLVPKGTFIPWEHSQGIDYSARTGSSYSRTPKMRDFEAIPSMRVSSRGHRKHRLLCLGPGAKEVVWTWRLVDCQSAMSWRPFQHETLVVSRGWTFWGTRLLTSPDSPSLRATRKNAKTWWEPSQPHRILLYVPGPPLLLLMIFALFSSTVNLYLL